MAARSRTLVGRIIAAVVQTKIAIRKTVVRTQRRGGGFIRTPTILSSHPPRFFSLMVGSSRSQGPPHCVQKRRGVPPATRNSRTHLLQKTRVHFVHFKVAAATPG